MFGRILSDIDFPRSNDGMSLVRLDVLLSYLVPVIGGKIALAISTASSSWISRAQASEQCGVLLKAVDLILGPKIRLSPKPVANRIPLGIIRIVTQQLSSFWR
ncbi:hypothetical protein C9413_08380 [Rhizobium sp. SEMIA 4085]|uniref:hypothetical protein n=1 Tax=Rhizobium sp. SEMIA 4085 TaxID=2137761 RepID=UPI00147908D9|nr:hypothetical protein [Rhizobium sp. SEMIA 4085]NNH29514.1 hypothetical protein [Rhizobium sp. SEMIA 4085]